MLKGAIHIHSTYSDGEFTLAELRATFLAEGCSFVCMTDHAEHLDAPKLRDYMQECSGLSDQKLRFVVGMEYECERRMHILGYGATRLAASIKPQEVIQHIEEQGAISVIAHPRDDFFEWIESFKRLPRGIETWNSKYDGRYGPRPGTFALLGRLQERDPGMLAFYGQDLHWKKQFRGLFVNVNAPTNDPQQILTALSRGYYNGHKGDIELPSSGVIPQELMTQFGKAHEQSYRMRRLLKNTKSKLDQLGIRVPESVKAQLRRIF